MHIRTDEDIRRRLILQANKHKMPYEFSFFYSDLTIDQVNALSPYIEDIPVLLFTTPTKEWTLLCTRKAIGFDGHQHYAVAYDEIEKLQPKVLAGITDTQQRFDTVKKTGKAEWHELTISTKAGKDYTFHANKGSEFFAMWNIILSAR